MTVGDKLTNHSRGTTCRLQILLLTWGHTCENLLMTHILEAVLVIGKGYRERVTINKKQNALVAKTERIKRIAALGTRMTNGYSTFCIKTYLQNN